MSIVEKAVDKHRTDRPHKAGRVINDARKASGPLYKKKSGTVDIELDHEKLAKDGVTPYSDTANTVVDEFRRIKRPLLQAAFENADESQDEAARKNLILVASALSTEGKTFTAMNLAMSIALERDRTVVLVDADVAKAHISRILEIEERPGLMDLLQDHTIDIGDVLLQTDMPSLRIIPAGKHHRHAAEMLSSQRMEAITEELSTRYSDRVIVFDSPPLLQASEAQALAPLVGQIILVVHAGQTPQRAVLGALDLLHDCDVRVVLNKCRLPESSPYHGGYYGQE
ncbi:MAG: XrtA-associated tyrosine autokinase [Gammaproteobacteria bacterium]|nr:XrtA-associated tyrosine autokinase [Gammaproteobacteria bacterium]